MRTKLGSPEHREKMRQITLGNKYALGHKQTPEDRAKKSLAAKRRYERGPRSMKYGAVHERMNRRFPRIGRCEYCARTDRKTDYASARHDRYTENRADWFELCRSCHIKFDKAGRKHT